MGSRHPLAYGQVGFVKTSCTEPASQSSCKMVDACVWVEQSIQPTAVEYATHPHSALLAVNGIASAPAGAALPHMCRPGPALLNPVPLAKPCASQVHRIDDPVGAGAELLPGHRPTHVPGAQVQLRRQPLKVSIGQLLPCSGTMLDAAVQWYHPPSGTNIAWAQLRPNAPG